MEDAALGISILALAISGWSLYYTHKRERRDEARFAREHEESEAKKRATVTASYLGRQPLERSGFRFDFRVSNSGPAAARNVGGQAHVTGDRPQTLPPFTIGTILAGASEDYSIFGPSWWSSFILNLWWDDDAGKNNGQSRLVLR